jgi:hypothetical protein
MHRSVTQHPRSPAARGRRRIAAATRSVRGPSRPQGKEADALQARNAWRAAMRVRKAVQARIVEAFRRHLEGAGPGPSDEDLLMFARLAVAEQRLMHRAA